MKAAARSPNVSLFAVFKFLLGWNEGYFSIMNNSQQELLFAIINTHLGAVHHYHTFHSGGKEEDKL